MIQNPILQIIFYLATLFMPSAATKFTISSGYGYDHKITWVRQTDGAWQATTDTGKDAGIWTVSGLSVSVVEHATTNTTDLSKFLKVENLADQKKQVLLDDRAVVISSTNSMITFSQDKDSPLFEPAVITYWTK
jgi:hypothetical protein